MEVSTQNLHAPRCGFVYKYVVPGEPIPLARPRFAQGVVWDSQKEKKLYWGLHVRRQHCERPFLNGPLQLDVAFFFGMPRVSRRKFEQLNGAYHTNHIDLDNLIKFVCDAAQGILYQNDSKIVVINAAKYYDVSARTEFTLRELT